MMPVPIRWVTLEELKREGTYDAQEVERLLGGGMTDRLTAREVLGQEETAEQRKRLLRRVIEVMAENGKSPEEIAD